MNKVGKVVGVAAAAATAFALWRSSMRSRTAEAWERAFLREGLSGPGYAPPQNPARVVFLGDSITAAWPLADTLPDIDARNAGCNGDLLSEMRERWRASVLARDAGIVHLLGATNNITSGYSLKFMQREFVRLAELAQVSRMRVILGTVPPMRGSRARLNEPVRQLNAWLTLFAAEQNIVVADYYTLLADEAGELRAEFAAVLPHGKLDTVHLNNPAYEAMAPIARQAIAQVRERG